MGSRAAGGQQLCYEIGRLSPEGSGSRQNDLRSPGLLRQPETQAWKNSAPRACAPGQESNLESDQSGLHVPLLIGLHGAGGGVGVDSVSPRLLCSRLTEEMNLSGDSRKKKKNTESLGDSVK